MKSNLGSIFFVLTEANPPLLAEVMLPLHSKQYLIDGERYINSKKPVRSESETVSRARMVNDTKRETVRRAVRSYYIGAIAKPSVH